MIRKSAFKLPLILGLFALLTLGLAIAFSTTTSAAPQNSVALEAALSNPQADGTEPLPAGVIVETVIPNLLDGPVAMAWAPDGRLFFNDRNSGNVRVYANGVLQNDPVIHYNVDTCSERGLLGLALDPDFESNHYVYVYYTAASGCGSTTNRVARFVETNGVGAGSTDIFSSTQTAGNHNGGNIHFGQDNKLYISIGDNASAGNSQNVTVKNGKMHRINPDGTIPGDNPVFTQTGALPSLYAFGLRNSFDFDIDPLTALSPYPRIFASENGPSCDDEMNRIEAGYNYGWRASYPCDDPNPSITYNTIAPLWYLPSGQCCMDGLHRHTDP
jgi:glucose/arabinose dehydrogenase